MKRAPMSSIRSGVSQTTSGDRRRVSNAGRGDAQPTGTKYDRAVVDAVLRFLEDCAKRAPRARIAREAIVLDPGIGFGKTADQNIEVLRQLDRIVALGFPTMIGTSRKSTIGRLTGREAADRVYGTAATTALAIAAGIDMVRVHDVAAARDVVGGSRCDRAQLETGRVDTINLRGIRAYGRHGADPGERERRQPFDIDVTAKIDLQRAAATDDLAQTLDYAALRERLVASSRPHRTRCSSAWRAIFSTRSFSIGASGISQDHAFEAGDS